LSLFFNSAMYFTSSKVLLSAGLGPTIADAILDRLVHGSYRIEMTGESMRKKLSVLTDEKG
jgi:DNA replication protein DnaC